MNDTHPLPATSQVASNPITTRLAAWSRRVLSALRSIGGFGWVGTFGIAFAYTTAYRLHQHVPYLNSRHSKGWWGWHDQKKYRAAAEAIWNGTLGPETHHYPIGYPLLGAPFTSVLENHPFFVPNVILATAMGIFFYKIARLWLGRWESVLALTLACLGCHEALDRSIFPPWSTQVTHAIGYAMLWLFLTRRPSYRLVYGLVLLDGYAFLCRPGDAFYLSPLLIAAVLQLPAMKDKILAGSSGIALMGIFPAITFLVNHIALGSSLSPYESRHSMGFAFRRIPVNLYTTLLDGMPVYRFHEPVILERMPWMLLALPGAIYVIRRTGWRAAVAIGTAGFGFMFYMAYQNISPIGLYKYALIHYVTWTFPLVALGVYLTFRHALWRLSPRISLPALFAPMALAWCLRLEESDPLPAHIGDSGEIVADAPVSARGYDLLLIQGFPYKWGAQIRRGGELLERGPDYHYPRTLHKSTSLSGIAMYIPRRFRPGDISFVDRRVRGSQIELRRLRWRLTSVPPMVMKRRTHRSWGVRSLDFELVIPSDQLLIPDPSLDEGGPKRVEDPTVVAVSPILELARGTYVAELSGAPHQRGTLRLEVWRLPTSTDDPNLLLLTELPLLPGRKRVGRRTLSFRPHTTPTALGHMNFTVHPSYGPIQLRIVSLDGETELPLHDIRLKPHRKAGETDTSALESRQRGPLETHHPDPLPE